MRTLLLTFLSVMCLGARAQPSYDGNYCGFAPNDSIDITRDGIPDLVVLGLSSGTDNEPSSSGACQLYLQALKGMTLLSERDRIDRYQPTAFADGDTIPRTSNGSTDPIGRTRWKYTEGIIMVAYWGYGHQSAPISVTPNLTAKRYVFRTMHQGALWHGCFSIDPMINADQVTIHVGAFMPVEQVFIVR